ncbi:MAG TPA: NAD(P)/FAD-dependent oxidoreductase, partial [Negativicutes bacterium]|nr:NAD(P)/FAD-dependent oxidoreductase [Negativicutes bacterium]
GYTIMIGGCAGGKPRLADVIAQSVPQEEVLPLVDKIIAYYRANANKYERIGRMIDRLGLEKVKQDLLG